MPINEPSGYGGGVLANVGAQGGEQVPPQAREQDQDSGMGMEPVDAEEQDYYDRVIMSGMRVLFEDDATRNKIVGRLKADKGQPAKTLADTTAMLMIQLDQKANGEIPETVILPAATEMLEQVAGLADSLNLFPIDDAVLNHAAQLMVMSLGEQYGVEPEDLEELLTSVNPEQLQQIVDQQGNFARKQPAVPNEETQDG
jgi:hypothetical protein